jgi:excisionase family DNA binding protein
VPNLNSVNSSLPPGAIARLAVKYGRIPAAVARYGLSRSRLYILAAEGKIRFVKDGKATLVDFESVDTYLVACPAADVHVRVAAGPQPDPPTAASPRLGATRPRALAAPWTGGHP